MIFNTVDSILIFFGERKDALLVMIALLAALASILAALASAYSAYITANTSRKNHITSLRENWINEIRTDISELMNIRSEIAEKQSTTQLDLIVAKIRLKLDNTLSDHTDLDQTIEQFRDSIGVRGDLKGDIDITLKLLNDSRTVLNNAWNKAAEGKL